MKKENLKKIYKEKDFRDTKFLAKGGFGEIYSSYSIKDDKEVCLKRINIELMRDKYENLEYPEDSYERDLNNEIEILKLFSKKKKIL